MILVEAPEYLVYNYLEDPARLGSGVGKVKAQDLVGHGAQHLAERGVDMGFRTAPASGHWCETTSDTPHACGAAVDHCQQPIGTSMALVWHSGTSGSDPFQIRSSDGGAMVKTSRAIAVALAIATTAAVAAPRATSAPPPQPTPASTASVAPADRDRVLGRGWSSSRDRAVTTDGDMTGLHVLVADERDGYAWRTAATLTEPATDTDQWLGQACVTGSGSRAVVVYAPRQFANRDELFQHGALAAIVDLDTGAVTKLPEPVTMAYYDPGCGAGETAVLTEEVERQGHTVSHVMTVDTVAGKITGAVDVPGQVTSSVPAPQGIVGAEGNRLVRVEANGTLDTLTTNGDTPFRLAVDAVGGVGFEVQRADKVEIHRYTNHGDQLVLTTDAQSVRLNGVAGHVYVQGKHVDRLPESWRSFAVPVDAEVSTTGALAVDSSVNGHEAAGDTDLRGTPAGAQPVQVIATALATGAVQSFLVRPNAAHGGAPSPAVTGTGAAAAKPNVGQDPSTITTDPNRTCAIARNDPGIQSLQETPQMAEWAADLAVKNALTVQRPAGYNGANLPAYTPQALFPDHSLIGGGHVPAQVLLGVMAQESNMWQASPHAVDGESGNFEQGGFYGLGGGVDSVDFAHADCGYGAMQVTTGMRTTDSTWTGQQQLALTVDYAANIAAGLEILEDKWNQLKQLGVTANNGDPSVIENWWFALWAYNTGWHYSNDPSDPNSRPDAHGLGWSNNVRNGDYPADRGVFLDNTTSCTDDEKGPNGDCIDAKHPNDWSYPERVIGYASHSLTRYDWQSGQYSTTFETGRWVSHPLIPRLNTFCTMADNQCDPNTTAANHCTRADFTCFWHESTTWITDYSKAGTEQLAYQPGSAEPTTHHFYQPDCSSWDSLPANVLVVDDVPASVHTVDSCAKLWSQHGTLSFKFAADNAGNYPSKIDLHQLDTGFGGHFWLAHAWENTAANAKHGITGTWTLDQQINGWARVLVYVPDHGAMDPQAFYTVHGSDSTSPTRSLVEGNYLDDSRKPAAGHWESLGAFHFAGTPSVSLDNLTHAWVDGQGLPDGERDVSWDAVAFQLLPGKPADQVVAMGDSYSSGEGVSNLPVNGAWDYYRSSDHDGPVNPVDDPAYQDGCHRSPYAWPRVAKLPDSGSSIGARADSDDPTLNYHMTACSGALTQNMLPDRPGQYQEGGQLAQGYLDQNTTVVTLSVGGNDARFGPIISQCLTSLVDCPASTLAGDSGPLLSTEPGVITNQVGPAVANVLAQIKRLAPNAKIMLMGYPHLFVANTTCQLGIDPAEEEWLGQMADLLDNTLAQVAKNAGGTTFADPRGAFTGKGVCGDPAQIHGVFAALTRGDTPQQNIGPYGVVSAQSFHPTVDGAATYAGVATSTLKTMFP
jgi:hypothetical protein